MKARNKLVVASAFKNYFILWVVRIAVCYLLIAHITIDEDDLVQLAERYEMSAMRYFVGIVTHILVCEATTEGFTSMKYALNHPWKFNRHNLAILTGLMGIIVAVIIELTTFYILAYQSDSSFDILANYAIVLVIVDFDSNFYSFEGS